MSDKVRLQTDAGGSTYGESELLPFIPRAKFRSSLFADYVWVSLVYRWMLIADRLSWVIVALLSWTRKAIMRTAPKNVLVLLRKIVDARHSWR